MKTRRSFLQAGSLIAAAQLASPSFASPEQAGSWGDALAQRAYWNDYPNYLISVIGEARTRRKRALANIKTAADAARRASFTRGKVWESIGGTLDKTPLNVVTTGAIERDGYRVEKLIFESQPQFFVPAHLYLPKSGRAPFPSILAPLGHTSEGKSFRSYQTLFQNLARKGFIVLTWDPPGQGERLQYPVPGTNRSRFGPTGEHYQFGWPALLIGSTTTQFEAWDGVRALDYLAGRSDVDRDRIGCCGHSGGGTMTMFLCALEPRIHVAVVVEGHTENLAGAHYEPPGAYADAEQNLIGGLQVGIDRGDLLAAFAPKPLLLCFTHMDVGATYSAHYEEGTKEIYQELKDVYGVHRAADKVALSDSVLPHDYDFFHRRATYDWFNRWLGTGHADSSEAPFDESTASELLCTSTGQILTSVGGRTAWQINSDRLRAMQSSRSSAAIDKAQVRRILRKLLNVRPPSGAVRASTLSKNALPDIFIEEFEFQSEPEIRVPGWFLKPASRSGKLPTVVLLSASGKNRLFDQVELLAAVAQGKFALCAIDLRASGQATPRLPAAGPLFNGHSVELGYAIASLTAGLPLVGQRVSDVIRCLDYLGTRSEVDDTHIGLYGVGTSGLEALFTAALDDRVKALLLEQTPSDLSSVVTSDEYNLKLASFSPGFLRHFDLDEICASVAPCPAWLVNPVNQKGEVLPSSEASGRYAKAVKAYSGLRRPDRLTIRIAPGGSERIFDEWVRSTLTS